MKVLEGRLEAGPGSACGCQVPRDPRGLRTRCWVVSVAGGRSVAPMCLYLGEPTERHRAPWDVSS